MPVEKGNKLKVEYTGLLDDGTVFDSSEKHNKPLEFEAGAGMVIKGFDDAVLGMELNEEKEVKISSKDAYGEKRDELVIKMPVENIPKDQDIKKGMMLIMGTPEGQQMPAVVLDIDNKDVTLDLNHPLAGKNLTFKLKLVSIE